MGTGDQEKENGVMQEEASRWPAQHVPVLTSHAHARTFAEALQWVLDGHRITRIQWGRTDRYVWLRGEWLCHIGEDGQPHTLLVRDVDLMADDWVRL